MKKPLAALLLPCLLVACAAQPQFVPVQCPQLPPPPPALLKPIPESLKALIPPEVKERYPAFKRTAPQ